MAFAQLTYRESLRDIEACLRLAAREALPHGYLRSPVARNTLSNANATRDWRIYADFAQRLIGDRPQALCRTSPFGVQLANTAYALDSTTIDLSPLALPVGAVPLDQGRGEAAHAARSARQYPDISSISADGKLHDVCVFHAMVNKDSTGS
jgi:hypothetical protein